MVTAGAALWEPREEWVICRGDEVRCLLLFHLLNIMEYGLFVVGLYFYLLHFIIFTKA